MAEQITLNPVADITQSTSAQNTINANNDIIKAAFLDVLSLSGTAPNQMQSELDMNSHQVLNLPSPATANSPLRLQDLSTFTGGGTVTNIPIGGTTGQVLAKNSNTNFDTAWISESSDLAAGTNISITGSSPATISTVQNPNFTTSVTTPFLVLNGNTLSATAGSTSFGSGGTVAYTGNPLSQFASTTSAQLAGLISDETGSGSLVFNTSPTLTAPTITAPAIISGGSISTTGSDSNFNAGGNRGFVDKSRIGSLNGGGAANPLTIISNNTAGITIGSSGSLQFNAYSLGVLNSDVSGNITSSLNIPATAGATNAPAGFVGEFISSTVVSGSAVALTTATPANVTSISLTAGDWDVSVLAYFQGTSTTSITVLQSSLSTTSATLNSTPGNLASLSMVAVVPGATIPETLSIPPLRFSLASTATIFLVSQATFTLSTLGAYGIIRARRVR